MPRSARAVQPPAPLPLRRSASAWRSSRARAGSDRGWQSPCGRTRRRDPREAFARRCSPFRRTPASPSRQEGAGCLCCSRSIPGRRPDAGHPPAPVASASGRTRPDAARPRSAEAPTQGSVPAAGGRAPLRTRCVMGGSERAMSAITRTRLFGSRSTIAVILSAQESARFRPMLALAMRAPTRRRFSMSARRSMIGIAHSSPRLSGVTVWYAVMNRTRLSVSTLPSPCEMASSAMS